MVFWYTVHVSDARQDNKDCYEEVESGLAGLQWAGQGMKYDTKQEMPRFYIP